MTTSLEKLSKVIQRLLAKTQIEAVDWKEQPIHDVFQASLGKLTVQLSVDFSELDPEADPDYYFTVLEGQQAVDTVSDVDLRKYLQNSYQIFRELYAGARRKARNLSDVADELDAALGDDDL